MASHRPLVIASGVQQQMPSGDTIVGGLPAGGAANLFLRKSSATDFAAAWFDADTLYPRLDASNTGPSTTASATANAYTATVQAGATLTTGRRFLVRWNAANTGDATLTLTPSGGSALATKSIRRLINGVEMAPLVGDIQAGLGEVIYDASLNSAAGGFLLLNPQAVPSFEATKSADQSITTQTQTKITFQNKTFDPGSLFNTSTGKIQPAFPCKLDIEASLYHSAGVDASSSLIVSIYKNGSAAKTKLQTIPNTQPMSGTVRGLIDFNGSTDYAEIYGYASGSTSSKTISSTVANTFVIGVLVS